MTRVVLNYKRSGTFLAEVTERNSGIKPTDIKIEEVWIQKSMVPFGLLSVFYESNKTKPQKCGLRCLMLSEWIDSFIIV